MGNLFSSFDPNSLIIFIDFPFNWLSTLIILGILPQSYWLISSQYTLTLKNIFAFIINELRAVFGVFVFPGTIFIYICLLIFIFFSNFLGLIPYIFTSTSHFSITLSLSLPLWIGSILLSIIYQYNNLLAHLVPRGTPRFLIPVIVIIETVSNIIRPATLAIRLAANMVAGHLLLTLLGSQGPLLRMFPLVILFLGLVLLLLLEVAVACIQSYVFTILSSLYLGELISAEFNKKILV